MPLLRLENFQQFAAINVLSDPGHIGGAVLIPNCVQISLRWTLADGKVARNVIYGRSVGAPSPTVAQADAIFAALGTGAAWTALALNLSAQTAFAGVDIRSVHAAFQPIVSSTAAAKPGTDAGISLPNEVAAVITLRTGLTGPSNRGRMYIPGFAVGTVQTQNTMAAGTVTALTNWAATIPGALTAQGYTWVIGQPARAAYVGTSGTAHPARAAASQAVTSQSCRNNTWDSQRRRGLK
jgi:hypothetical protein